MKLALHQVSAYIINLDRSHERWLRCASWMREHLPELAVQRVSGVDGRNFFSINGGKSLDGEHGWNPKILRALQTEGTTGQKTILDPVRTALCLSHQRVLKQFLEFHRERRTAVGVAHEPWALIFEDDVRPGEALADQPSHELYLEVPPDSEMLFLHDRVWKRGGWKGKETANFEEWRVVRGGIGLEAYAVSLTGARKVLSAFRPVIHECDLQLMTFMKGYADLEQRDELRDLLRQEGHSDFPEITAYAPVRPLFQTDHWLASVKFDTIEEGLARANREIAG